MARLREIYQYKGNLYEKIDEIQSKNPVTREWDVYVLYKNERGHLFSREIGEFNERFTLHATEATLQTIWEVLSRFEGRSPLRIVPTDKTGRPFDIKPLDSG